MSSRRQRGGDYAAPRQLHGMCRRGAQFLRKGLFSVEGRSMPEPTERNRRYIPGLDGCAPSRCLKSSRNIGLPPFFLGRGFGPRRGRPGGSECSSLSGYLITDLLLAQLERGDHLRAFLDRACAHGFQAFVRLIIVTAW